MQIIKLNNYAFTMIESLKQQKHVLHIRNNILLKYVQCHCI